MATFGVDLGFSARCCVDKQSLQLSRNPRAFDNRTIRKFPCAVFPICSLSSSKTRRVEHRVGRLYSVSVNVEESSSLDADDFADEDESSDSPKTLSKEELMALLADSQRAKLNQKLSEANQQNRYLKRQLHEKEGTLVNFKSQIAVMELEIQALVALSEEIIKLGIPEGSRKINGRYIQSHLHFRLAAIQEKLKEQIKDVDAVQSKEVALFWCGMAESVQVMGSFDGWSQGEHLSPEYTGSYTKFSATLMLRPGRYEIKFLVNGQWQLSPEFPVVGEGLMKNNLLVVE